MSGLSASEGPISGLGSAESRVAELEEENARLRAALEQRDDTLAQLNAVAMRESQIRLVADSLPVLISYVDSSGRYRFNNKAYERWFGHRRRDLFGKHLAEVLGERAYEALRPLVEAALAGERVSVDRVLPYKDGGERTVHIDYVPDRRDDGTVAGFFAMVLDISERQRVEQNLRESEARFRAMADSAPAPIWVTGEDGIEFVNRAMVEFLGRPAEELLGQGWVSSLHPDDLPDMLERRAAAWAGEEIGTFDSRFRGADGEWRWLHGSLKPRFDDSGALLGFVGLGVDVTEERSAEAELRESEARFRAMADSAPAPVWVTNEAGIEFVNQAMIEFSGLSKEALVGHAWMTLVHPDDLPAVLERRVKAWEERAPYSFDARFRRGDGEWRWMRASCNPRKGGAGDFLGYVGLAVDLTDSRRAAEALQELNQTLEHRVEQAVAERERAEEALRQSQKMEAVGQLTGGIAHDFNNLLTVIVGNLDAARRRLGEDADTRILRSIGSALVGAERAATLTQRLLAFSRRQPLTPKPIDPNALVTGMTDLLHRTLGEMVRVETVLAPGLWRTEVDPHQLENAILNLAVNARDAMPEGGSLIIETANVPADALPADAEGQGPSVLIRMTDTGTGMDAEMVARACEPFFTTKEVGKGTGLGLSMVYGFVKQSGGHFEIESVLGRGTGVSIFLPRLHGPHAAEEQAGDAEALQRGQDETVLVCEDDDDVRAYTVEVLSELGYRVLEAADGPAALRIVAQGTGDVDLLFTDVVLPGGMTGAELARHAVEARPGLKILFTTGYARDFLANEGRLDPGIELIAKPFASAELAARIREILES